MDARRIDGLRSVLPDLPGKTAGPLSAMPGDDIAMMRFGAEPQLLHAALHELFP